MTPKDQLLRMPQEEGPDSTSLRINIHQQKGEESSRQDTVHAGRPFVGGHPRVPETPGARISCTATPLRISVGSRTAPDRQPLVRPERRNQVWSADFVFDRTADGRVMKCLTIVDDATHEAVAIVPARAFGGLTVTRVLDRLAITRGLPQILRTDNGKEFCGRAMLTWAHTQGLTLRLIEPGKPNQNAYIESFNGRFRDECLNEHWFTTLA